MLARAMEGTFQPLKMMEYLPCAIHQLAINVFCCCRTSLIGHLAGILVGLLYTAGPLEAIMTKCAGLYLCACKQ